jgi:tetratricopeptide (TPR) repeat protein
MPPILLKRIVERADGVPLFAEELSRLSVVSPDLGKFVIPASLQDLLMARLDGLADEDKRIVRLAATIGREFSARMVAQLLFLNEPKVLMSLFRLRYAGLVSIDHADRWQFRHALIRDAAYMSQTRADRVSAHRRIAQIYEAEFPEICAGQPELLAYHWSLAGATERAVEYRLRAGLLAQTRSAHLEAIKHFKEGVELLPRLENVAVRRKQEWSLHVGLGASSYAVEGYASPQGAAAYHRSVELGEQAGNLEQSFPALWGLWAGASSHSSWEHSMQLAKRLVRMVRSTRDPVARQQGNFALGNVQFWRGEFTLSCDYLRRAIKDYAPHQHGDLVANYGENAYVTSGSYLSWSLCMLGFPQQALEAGNLAVVEAKRAGHPFTLGYALTFFTALHRMLRQPERTLELAEETIALANKHDFPLWNAGATLDKGWAQVMLGKAEGLVEMQRSVDRVVLLMGGISLIFLETQADGLLYAGKPRDALVVIDRALELVERLDDHHVEAELYRLQGSCLLELSTFDSDRAEVCFRRALKISRRQKALLLELRAARAMAHLWAQQKKTSSAHRLLTGVYLRFMEGFDTTDLRATTELLDNIAS